MSGPFKQFQSIFIPLTMYCSLIVLAVSFSLLFFFIGVGKYMASFLPLSFLKHYIGDVYWRWCHF